MTVVSPSQSNAGDTIEASDINTPVNQLAAVINGNIDATNITDNSVTNQKVASGLSSLKLFNPYKFAAYRSAAQSTTGGSFVKINFDTKLFDTGSNYDNTTNFRFTAPSGGFYQFNTTVSTGSSVGLWIVAFYKNGVEFSRGTKINATGAQAASHADLIQLAASDYMEVFVFSNTSVALEVGTSSPRASFSGFMVSST